MFNMDKLQVSNHLPFTDMVLRFSSFNLFIGKNGIGKSRLLEYIFKYRDMPSEPNQIIKEDRFIERKTRYRPGAASFENVFNGCQNFDVDDERKADFNLDMNKLFKREFHLDNFENRGRTIIIKKGDITTTPENDGRGILKKKTLRRSSQ